MSETSESQIASRPFYEVRCRVEVAFRPLDNPLGEVIYARKALLASRAELEQAMFDLKRESERRLVFDIMLEGWQKGMWPAYQPDIQWEVWEPTALGPEGQPGAYVAYKWPQE